jgi:hypothetical protein
MVLHPHTALPLDMLSIAVGCYASHIVTSGEMTLGQIEMPSPTRKKPNSASAVGTSVACVVCRYRPDGGTPVLPRWIRLQLRV